MSVIEIDRETCRQLETLLEMWGTPLPEALPRQQMVVGQPYAEFLSSVRATFTAFGIFSSSVGGNLVWHFNVRPPRVHVMPGDTIIYHFHWQTL